MDLFNFRLCPKFGTRNHCSKARHTTKSTDRVATLNAGLQGFTTASQEVANRMETHIAKPLAEHQRALDGVWQQMTRSAEQIERVAKQLEATAVSSQGESTTQLLTQLSDLKDQISQTNNHFNTLLVRIGDGSGQKPRMFKWLFGSSASRPPK